MDALLSEEEVKKFINDYLSERGFHTTVAWRHSRGADIVAQKGDERAIIEVKGCGSRQPMRVNYFLAILGEILQRMDDSDCSYYIALPYMKQYLNLWNRLPELAKNRTKIQMIFVDNEGRLEFFH